MRRQIQMTHSNKNLQIMKYVINLMQHDFNEDADSAYRVKLLILKNIMNCINIALVNMEG